MKYVVNLNQLFTTIDTLMTKWYGNLRLSELNENPESGWIYYNVWGDGSYSEEMEQPPFTLKIENGEVTNIYSNYHPPKFKQLDRLVEKTDDILISYFKKKFDIPFSEDVRLLRVVGRF
jgi:hypothetical protein